MPNVPFIFVTGAMQNELVAQHTILKGANEFVLKNKPQELDFVSRAQISQDDNKFSAV